MLLVTRRISLAWVVPAVLTCQVKSFAPLAANHLSRTDSARALFSFFSVPIASTDEVKSALADQRAVVMDVRSQDEILETGYFKTDRRWIHAQCTPMDAKFLALTAEGMIQDKDTPVIIYCGSGKRASKAKEVLESQGYTTVLNAGGWGDVCKLK